MPTSAPPHPICWYIGEAGAPCRKPAEWRTFATGDGDPYGYTEACSDHLATLIALYPGHVAAPIDD